MPSTKPTKKQRVNEWLGAHQPAAIHELEWRALLAALAPISESYLRELLHATGIPMQQPYAGIRQHTLDELEASLLSMREACDAATPEQARYCRRVVIQAKDRARAAARTTGKRELKLEMAQWMLVWLESPAVFPAWAAARRKVIEARSPKP